MACSGRNITSELAYAVVSGKYLLEVPKDTKVCSVMVVKAGGLSLEERRRFACNQNGLYRYMCQQRQTSSCFMQASLHTSQCLTCWKNLDNKHNKRTSQCLTWFQNYANSAGVTSWSISRLDSRLHATMKHEDTWRVDRHVLQVSAHPGCMQGKSFAFLRAVIPPSVST